jgi:lysophospholipase L1-like esterase
MHYKMSLITTIIVLLALIYSGFFFYRKNYLYYNLLRLDPLEESKIDYKSLATNKDTLDIWLLGDSRIAHWNKNFFSSIRANIVNLGIEGQTSKQVLDRLKSHLEFGKPDWIILEVGINDLKVIGLEKNLANKIEEKCYNNIISIIALCRKNGIKVICCSIFPNGNIELTRRLVWDSSIDTEIVEINKKLINYCKNNNIEYFDAYHILLEKNYKVKEKFQNGFLHLNDQAYLVLSKQLIMEFGDTLKSKNYN